MTREPMSVARLESRRELVDHIVRTVEGTLLEEFGTAWEFVDGGGFHTLTHSRDDVLPAARRLAAASPLVELLDPALAPLVELAAIFHAHGGNCGVGVPAAGRELLLRPAFDDEDRELVTHMIEGVRDADVRPGGYQQVTLRVGTGLEAEEAAVLETGDLMAAILADADRAHLGLSCGLHRLLLQVIERHPRDELEPPAVSDGRDLVLDPVVVRGLLLQAADTCERHEFVFAVSDELFPQREQNAELIRAAVAALDTGLLSWPELIVKASFRGQQR